MSIYELTTAILEKDFDSAKQHAGIEIMQRVSERLDAVRDEVTKNLFKEAFSKTPTGNPIHVDYMKKVEDKEDDKYIDKLTHLTKKSKENKAK